MEKLLKVKPLKKYKIPTYPAFGEEDPLNPKKKKLSKASYYMGALLGAVGLFSCSSSEEVKENSIKFNVKSTFGFNELGFPHTYASFGTGVPERLDRGSAIAAIDSVFKANDIPLIADFPIQEGEGKFWATGYNPESEIGFVWLDGYNTTYDCYNSRMNPYKEEDFLEENLKEYKEINRKFEERLEQVEKREEKNLIYEERRKEMDSFHNKLKQQNYYKLVRIKKDWSDKIFTQKIKEYMATNLDYTRADYGQSLIDEYEDARVDLQEMESIKQSDSRSIGAFSTFNHGYHYHFSINHRYTRDEDGNMVLEKLDKPSPKEISLDRLATMVQEYIDWAKSEGRF